MIPVKLLRRTDVRPYMTYLLLAINIGVFLWELSLPTAALNAMFFEFAANSCQITTGFFAPRTWLDMLRTMFLHGSYLHLAGNMMFLVLFAPSMEEYFGARRFLLFYLLGGFAAAITHALVKAATVNLGCELPMMGEGFVPLIGASGAIAALMGGFILMHPGVKVQTFVPLIGPFGPVVKLPAFVLLGYIFVIDIINGFTSITSVSGVSSQVAHWAHIGGFIFGGVTIFIATMWKPAPPQNIIED